MARDKVRTLGDEDLGILQAIHPATGNEIEVSFAKDVVVVGDPKQEALDLPRKYAWYARLRDIVENRLRESQHYEYNVEEDLYIEMRRKFDDEGVKTTETDLKTRVKAHPLMREAYRRRNEAERLFKEASSVVSMLQTKLACLQAYAKMHAAELGVGVGD